MITLPSFQFLSLRFFHSHVSVLKKNLSSDIDVMVYLLQFYTRKRCDLLKLISNKLCLNLNHFPLFYLPHVKTWERTRKWALLILQSIIELQLKMNPIYINVINWVTQSPAFILYKKKTEVCFIMCIDGIDHAQRTLHDLFIYLFICLAASFDCDYRLLSGQLYKNMNVKHL